MIQDLLAAGLSSHLSTDTIDRGTSTQSQKTSGRSGDDPARLREAAQEFEALFLGYMLTVMRSTIDNSSLGEQGSGRDIYTELFDQELARSLATRGALGISDMIIRKLNNQLPSADPSVDALPESEPASKTGVEVRPAASPDLTIKTSDS